MICISKGTSCRPVLTAAAMLMICIKQPSREIPIVINLMNVRRTPYGVHSDGFP